MTVSASWSGACVAEGAGEDEQPVVLVDREVGGVRDDARVLGPGGVAERELDRCGRRRRLVGSAGAGGHEEEGKDPHGGAAYRVLAP